MEWLRSDRPLAVDDDAASFMLNKEDGRVLEFDQLATRFKDEIDDLVSAGDKEGFYRPVALCSPWGGGKTSFVKRVMAKLDDDLKPGRRYETIYFNPWVFSSRDDIIEQFFVELALHFGRIEKTKQLAKEVLSFGLKIMRGLGRAVTEVASGMGDVDGAGAGFAGRAALAGSGALLEEISEQAIDKLEKQWSLREQKERICDTLSKGDLPVMVVFIDDIDRLEDAAIRDLFRFISAVADFPGVLYVLSFDYDVVERALGEMQQGAKSEPYIDKIVSFRFNLPHLEIPGMIKGLLCKSEDFSWLEDAGAEHVLVGLANLLRTPRAVRKLCANYQGDGILGLPGVFGASAWERLMSVCARDRFPGLYSALRASGADFVERLLSDVERCPRLMDADRKGSTPEWVDNRLLGTDEKKTDGDDVAISDYMEMVRDILTSFLDVSGGTADDIARFGSLLLDLNGGRLEAVKDSGYLDGQLGQQFSIWLLLRLVISGRIAVKEAAEEKVSAQGGSVFSGDKGSVQGNGGISNRRAWEPSATGERTARMVPIPHESTAEMFRRWRNSESDGLITNIRGDELERSS